MTKDPAILRAERVRVIMSMPEYSVTIGAWIEEAHESALHSMTEAKEHADFLQAKGAYLAIQELKDQFQKVFSAEKAATEKARRAMTKKD